MKLLLHIGRPKTGTNSLQHFLYLNRNHLSEGGFFLFDDIGSPNNIDFAAFFSSNPFGGLKGWSKRRGITNLQEKDAYFSSLGFVESVDRQIASASKTHHTAIITSEHLSSALQRQDDIEFCVRFLLKRFDAVEVVCFFRDQVDLLPSRWSTGLKSGETVSLNKRAEASVKNQRLNYVNFAEKWSQSFGRENLVFFLYDQARTWDIRRYFAETFLPGVGDLKFPSQRANRAYGSAAANFVRLVNILFPFWLPGARKPNPKNLKTRKRFLRVFTRYSRPVKLSARQARMVRQAYQESNAEFSRAYLPHGQSLE